VSAHVLVAGIGNVFLGDDGFGVEVVRALAERRLPPDVRVADFGIRGIHLAYEMLAGYETVILVDAVARGGAPGTLYVIEPDLQAPAGPADAHSMELTSVFAFMRSLGGKPPVVRVVGCEPADVGDGMRLSPPVAAAVTPAVEKIEEIITHDLHDAARKDGISC
jgi:hydrogenase maturation protease